jgi:FKBP-type peptidyl-prolyl cis-trans isomerase FklB
MKKIILPVFVLMGLVSFSQVKKKTTTATPAQPVLKTTTDSLSYAIGVSVAGFYREQGVKDVNTTLVARAINDALKNGKPLLNEQQCNSVIIGYVQKEKAAKSSENRKEGEAFLAANKTKPDVITLPSGLQYQILKQGDGPKPLSTDKVKCHYKGTLIDGTVFDSSIDRGQPIEFAVTGVIPGWTEALQLMPVGSKWRLFIPSNLGYGDQGAGQAIKPGATLIFDIELLDIVK